MYEYSVVHTRKNEEVMVDTLNKLAKVGWKLMVMFEKTSSYMLVMERLVPMSSQPEPVEQPVVRRGRTKKDPILVTSEDTDAGSSSG